MLASPLVLGVAAVSATNNLLFMLLAAAMVTVVVSGVLSERNMRGVQVRIRPVEAAYVDEAVALDVYFQRPAGLASELPSFGLIVRESPQGIWPPWRSKALVSPAILNAQLAVLEGRRGRVVTRRRFNERGPARLGPCELVTTYPFALLNKARDLKVDVELIVRPRRVPCPPVLDDPAGLHIDGESHDQRGLGLEVYGLRERQEWDAAHRVHALRSMSLGRDVVLELAGAERPMAWLGVAHGPSMDPAAWERALELAQAALLAWERRGYAAGLTVSTVHQAPGTASVEALQDELARAEPTGELKAGPGLWLVPAGASRPIVGGRSVAVESNGQLGEVA